MIDYTNIRTKLAIIQRQINALLLFLVIAYVTSVALVVIAGGVA